MSQRRHSAKESSIEIQPTRVAAHDQNETLFPGWEQRLEEFAGLTPLKNIRELIDHVGAGTPSQRQFFAWELVKIDIADSIANGMDRIIEDYCDAFPQLLPSDAVPVDVVLEEQLAWRHANLPRGLEEYRIRFPHLSTVLERMAAPADDSLGGPEIALGDQIDEFLLLRSLGQGSFARVFLARQLTMQRLVALKVASHSGDEPRVLARLDHPNIVRVFDQRTRVSHPTTLIYMEYVPGGNLADVIRYLAEKSRSEICGTDYLRAIDQKLVEASQVAPEGSQPRRWLAAADWGSTVAWIGYQLALALHVAHDRKVCHRDVKPANILLTAEGIPRLADFNVSFAEDEGHAGAEENFGGSFAYMAPEQLAAFLPDRSTTAKAIDGRSDLYALAVVLWELWTGQRPWQSVSSGSLLELARDQLKQRERMITPPVSRSATERALGAVLAETLVVDPKGRPATGAEMASKLRLALYPDAAPMFNPQPGAARDLILRLPVWMVAGAIVLVPNVVAGIFNFHYNATYILNIYPEMRGTFRGLATIVNTLAYPLGAYLIVLYSRPIAMGLRAASANERVTHRSIEAAWRLGGHAAIIGGVIWFVAGLTYPTVLKYCHPDFAWGDACHFFFSLVLCGGVAWTIPFFGGAAAGVLVYYPKMIAATMQDAAIDRRIESLRRSGGRHLIAAAMVPLLAAALASDRRIVLLTLAVTALGVLFSFYAYQRFEAAYSRMSLAIARAPGPSGATGPSGADGEDGTGNSRLPNAPL
jgi:serine/threonine protein kinase